MNLKLQKYKKFRMQGLTQYDSALKAGYSRSVALTKTARIENQIDIAKLCEAKGLTDDKIIETHLDMMNAEVVNSLDGESKPNWNVRSKAVELAYKVKGHITNTVKVSGEVLHNHFIADMIDKADVIDVEVV